MRKILNLSASDAGAESIRSYIVENNLSVGDKLPSETELCDILGYSRPSIRESLKILEGSGVLVTKHGKGRYIKDFDYNQMIDNMVYHFRVHYKDFKEVVEVRKALEIQFLTNVTGLLSEDDFYALEEILDDLEQKVRNNRSNAALVEAHAEFHRRIYERYNNKLLDSLITMFATIQRTLSMLNRINTSCNDEFLKKHRDLLESLRSGDKKRVQACFSDHFSDYEHFNALNRY